MTEGLFPEAMFDAFAPDRVAPGALYLVSDDAPTGAILGAGAGVFQSAYVTLTAGTALSGDDLSPEGVAANWNAITDRTGEIVPRGRRAGDADREDAAGVTAFRTKGQWKVTPTTVFPRCIDLNTLSLVNA